MKQKPLPIGVDDFKEIIQKQCYYIDKTALIKDLIDKNFGVTLFTRPRRFGKTLNLSMLKYFFEDTGTEEVNQENRKLFEGLKIMNTGEEYLSHMCQYPVIFLTLKSAKQPNFSFAYEMLKKQLIQEYDRHQSILENPRLSDREKEQFQHILNGKAGSPLYLDALKFLSDCLYKHYGKKCIILLDEYDVPLENAYYEGFYDEMIGFIRSLFESALKTNNSLEFAVITGCLRISKESIFTGLNNLKIVSVLNSAYAEHFGFTEPEVEEMLRFYQLESMKEEIKEWYDGYGFGNVSDIYNPWSAINYVDSKLTDKKAFPRPYWSHTSSNSIVRDLIRKTDSVTKGELEDLMAGKTIEKPVHEDITYGDIYRSPENLWNFLFFTGYLKKTEERFEGRKIYIRLAIPNMEIASIYEDQIQNWFRDTIMERDLTPLYQALLSGDATELQQEIMKVLPSTISYMDSKEAFYHGFLLGLLMNLDDGYRIKSNRESDGRYDICIYNYDEIKPAAVIELKVAKEAKELETCAGEALKQIGEKKYDTELLDEGYTECFHVGIGFFRKKCRVKIQKTTIG